MATLCFNNEQDIHVLLDIVTLTAFAAAAPGTAWHNLGSFSLVEIADESGTHE